MARKIWQGDIFKYLNKCLGFKQINLARDMAQKVLRIKIDSNDDWEEMKSTYASAVSRIINGKKNGFLPQAEGQQLDAELFYDVFFRGIVDRSKETHQDLLKPLKNFLTQEEVDISEFEYANGDYETFVRAMVEAGLNEVQRSRVKEEPGERGNSVCVQQEVQQRTRPTLHSQNFFARKVFGREELLKDMEQRLAQNRVVVLSGLGGIGKTYLSEEYAVRHKEDYAQQQRISVSTGSSFQKLVLSLEFDHLNEQELKEEGPRFENRLRLLKNMDEHTLLILDNFDEPWAPLEDGSSGITPLLDFLRDTGLHMIITTRLTKEFASLMPLSVTALPEAEQLALFEYHLGRKLGEQDKAYARDILRCVEGHTLLIELSAKSIYEGDFTFREMLECLRSGEDADLPEVTVQKDGQRQDTIWRFVRKILFQIDLPKEQKTTLRQLSLLPTQGISRKLFRSLTSKNALAELEGRSWAIREDRNAESITRLHPVICEVVKKELCPTYKNCRSFIEALCRFLKEKPEWVKGGELCKLAENIAHELDFSDPEYSVEEWNNLRTMAQFCSQNYQYQSALDINLQALEVQKEAAEDVFDSACKSDLYTEIGELYQRLAKYKDAIKQFELAAGYQQNNTIEKAECYRKLGEVYRKASEYDLALEYDNAAINIFQNYSEPGMEDRELFLKIAEAKNAIGVVHLNLGDATKEDPKRKEEEYKQAKKFYEEALALRLKYKAEPNELAYSHHNIGTAFHRLKDYKNAAKKHREALELRENCKLKKTDIAASYAQLGNDNLELGEDYYEEAKKLIDCSLDIRKELLGENHPDYAWSLFSLSQWYEKTGDIEKAIETLNVVISIRENVLGPEHKYTQGAIQKREELRGKAKEIKQE